MGRKYAGILGYLSTLVVFADGLRHGSGAEAILLTATLSLIGYAALGYVLGALAQWIVEDSVKSKVAAEVAAQTTTESGPR